MLLQSGADGSANTDGSAAAVFRAVFAVLSPGSPAAQTGSAISRAASLAAGRQAGEMDGAGHGLQIPLGGAIRKDSQS